MHFFHVKRTHARTHARTYVRTHVRTYVSLRTYVRACVRACSVRACVRACVRANVRTYRTYVCTLRTLRTYVHTYVRNVHVMNEVSCMGLLDSEFIVKMTATYQNFDQNSYQESSKLIKQIVMRATRCVWAGHRVPTGRSPGAHELGQTTNVPHDDERTA